MNSTTTIPLKEKIHTDFELVKELDLVHRVIRDKAFCKFASVGFPSKRNEEYKYTPFDRWLNDSYNQQLFPDKTLEKSALDKILKNHHYSNAIHLVFVNGVINSELSNIDQLDSSLTLKAFQEFLPEDKIVGQSVLLQSQDPFVLLNGSFSNHGMTISVKENAQIDCPIHLIFISNSAEHTLVYNKIAIQVGKFAKVDFIETQLSLNTKESFVNHFVEFFLEENALANHLLVQDLGENTLTVNNTFANLEKHSRFNTSAFSFSGKVIRNNLSILLNAQECEAHLYGFYHPSAGELMDNHTLVDHKMPHCFSNELYKGVIENEGTAVFNGKVYVRQDAQKTNAYQSNKNILMGESSVVNTKPQLEIYADDVKCSHGSSTGFIDDESMFYLRSRGIGKEKAKALLLYAYAAELLENINIEGAKAVIEEKLKILFGN
jgi:Fe-S cluster assembly protein SufD